MPLSPGIDGVWVALANDATLLGYLGLTTSSSNADKIERIMTSEETDDPITKDVIPLVLIYNKPGRTDARTKQMYNDKICVDVYAANAYLTRTIGDRVFDVLHNATLPSPTYQVSACRFVYSSSLRTGISGVRLYRLWFDVSYYID